MGTKIISRAVRWATSPAQACSSRVRRALLRLAVRPSRSMRVADARLLGAVP
jgi:hypothetical protein